MALSATKFDALAKGSAVTLSGSDLVATVSSGTGSARANNKISGLTYFEMVIGATMTGTPRVGVCHPSIVFTGLLGATALGCGYNSTGTVLINNATVATIATYAANNNIGVAIDPSRGLIWFRVNGGDWNNAVIGSQNPVGAVGGISLATMTTGGGYYPSWGGTATSSATAKFASADWTYTAPTGYEPAVTAQAAPRRTNNQQRLQTVALTAPTLKSLRHFRSGRWYHPGGLYRQVVAGGSISGVVEEGGVPVAGRTVRLYDRKTGEFLGQATSAGDGTYDLDAVGRADVLVVALDPPYNALVYDNVVPA